MLENRIKEIMKKRGLKQEWLAQRAQINSTTLSRIIRGKMNPSLDVAMRIGEALELQIEEIWKRV